MTKMPQTNLSLTRMVLLFNISRYIALSLKQLPPLRSNRLQLSKIVLTKVVINVPKKSLHLFLNATKREQELFYCFSKTKMKRNAQKLNYLSLF